MEASEYPPHFNRSAIPTTELGVDTVFEACLVESWRKGAQHVTPEGKKHLYEPSATNTALPATLCYRCPRLALQRVMDTEEYLKSLESENY